MPPSTDREAAGAPSSSTGRGLPPRCPSPGEEAGLGLGQLALRSGDPGLGACPVLDLRTPAGAVRQPCGPEWGCRAPRDLMSHEQTCSLRNREQEASPTPGQATDSFILCLGCLWAFLPVNDFNFDETQFVPFPHLLQVLVASKRSL